MWSAHCVNPLKLNMLNDLQVCDYLLQQYAGDNVFSKGEVGNGDHGICWNSLTDVSSGDTDIFLRGSKKLEDWVYDLMAIPVPFEHDVMGPVHAGFYIGMPELASKFKTLFGAGPVNLRGHSLGASRAAILTILLNTIGVKVNLVTLFGCPHIGYVKFGNKLKSCCTRIVSYRNGDNLHHDKITDVPMIPFEFVHPVNDLVQVCGAPAYGDTWGPFRYHHMELYREGIAKIWK